MDRTTLGLTGCGLLAAGVFSPIISLPVFGNMSYFHNGQGDGIIVLALAAVAAGLLFCDRFKGVMWSGICSALPLAYTFINFQLHLAQMKAEMAEKMAGNPFGGLAEMAMQSVQLQWGWVVLVAGAGCLIGAGLKKDAA